MSDMDRRSVLLVSYQFPPFGGSGVQRALKLAKYLPQHGWTVHVLTAGHRHYSAMDETLLDELGERVIVHPVRGFEPGGLAAGVNAGLGRWLPLSIERRLYWRFERWSGRLRLPEVESLWVGSALRAARRIIRRHGIDVVLTTSPPHVVHRIGATLKREYRLPWIADLRDPIRDNFTFDSTKAGLRQARWRAMVERQIVRSTDRVVVTCPELADRLVTRYGSRFASKFVFIPNGFDPADAPVESSSTPIGQALPKTPARVSAESAASLFKLGYVGAFYGAQSVEPLRLAVRALVSRRPDLTKRLRIDVVGHVSGPQREKFDSTDLARFVFRGRVSHAEAIRAMASADALFLMTPLNEGGRYCIPAKVFEYLAFGRHVVALVHAGTELARILGRAGNTTVIHHGDGAIERLSAALEAKLLDSQVPAQELGRSREFLAPYLRSTQARQFAELLKTCRVSKRQCIEPASDSSPAIPTIKVVSPIGGRP